MSTTSPDSPRPDSSTRWFYRLLALIALVSGGACAYNGHEGFKWFLIATGVLLMWSDGVSPERMVGLWNTLRGRNTTLERDENSRQLNREEQSDAENITR
jgi:hypothetical protein